jgi:hypothetical protein
MNDRLTVFNTLARAISTVFAFVCFPQLSGVAGKVVFALAVRSMARESLTGSSGVWGAEGPGD